MANKAFDKHAEFCEKYMNEVHLTFGTLFKEGPTQKVLEHVLKLVNLKNQYSAWLTKETLDSLAPFETALQNIGASSYLVEALRNTSNPERLKAISEMNKVFNEVMSIGEANPPTEDSTDVTIEAVEQKLRAVLGIEQLTSIRQRLIEQAFTTQEPHW